MPPFAVLTCDNLPTNGRVTKKVIARLADSEVLAVDLRGRKVAWRYQDPARQFPYYSSAAVTGVWAAMTTPFTSAFELDEDGFRRNMRHVTKTLGVEGVFVCGTMGEFWPGRDPLS